MKLFSAFAAMAVSLVLAAGMLMPHRRADADTDPASCPGAQVDETVGGVHLSPAQTAVIEAILSASKGMGISRRGATIALQTAMQESTLRADVVVGEAVGAFQQIAPGPFSAYAGYDRTDPSAAAKGFFTVLLRRVPGYPTDPRPNHELAQVVQASGAGAALYAKHQSWAEAVTAVSFSGTEPASACAAGPVSVQVVGNTVKLPPQAGVSGTVVAGTAQVAKAIAAALAWLGTPYAWGGGDENGPTRGIRDNGVADAHGDYLKVGFDCSGLTLYAYAQAGVRLTRPSDAQLTGAPLVVPFSRARPGDLLFWGTHHVALYLGVLDSRHLMVEAPASGDVVKVSQVRLGGDFRGLAARPVPQQ
ncbi:C40 family peptidase [Saccharothrix variisporea]|uniref:NlpC/P60 family protein n=1 Tax=Saccharothrix variisporea TaxID=543527 RepID=A0A495X5U3_9PSEU|nr:C40 family peptidase [Saccharothrix variisporea]RKT69410.1 NlpC/P60 family protein [Saccharothrix variisporea]